MSDRRPVSTRYRWLVVSALLSLGVVLTIFAAQLDLTEEPEWLANLTPLQHFLVHVLFFVCGTFFGASLAFIAVSVFKRLKKRKNAIVDELAVEK
jgi:ABC-type Fe3+-siderophore transport system permease subunit